jgi:NAD(P)-dependent dehydrogenase (short-subunit alcohol dehydrogenase family)
MLSSLEEAVVLITGGASGIGLAASQLFSELGAEVIVADVAVSSDDGPAKIRFDVTEPDHWEPMLEGIIERRGRLDVVVLNAGVVAREPDIRQLSDAQYQRIMRVNVDGVVLGTRAAARIMAEHGGGAIVATASVAGLRPHSPDPAYAMTKHAVVGFVRSAAEALAGVGVTLNAVAPSAVDTPIVADIRQEMLNAGYEFLPAKQVAEAIVLAAQSDLTGQCWLVTRHHAVSPVSFPEFGDSSRVAALYRTSGLA